MKYKREIIFSLLYSATFSVGATIARCIRMYVIWPYPFNIGDVLGDLLIFFVPCFVISLIFRIVKSKRSDKEQ